MKKTANDKAGKTILGIMSGTSLDGTDLALCSFGETKGAYTFSILKAVTIPYPAIWKQRLSSISTASAEKYFAMDAMYGQYIAQLVNDFLEGAPRTPEAIASHGHTVFHQPRAGFSAQIGSGATIAALTGITTVCDFRSMDVAMGGQGAPLVPVGDRLLFAGYHACLNLGGIANISYELKGKRIAYDVCPANMLLNYLSESLGADYDKGGAFAKKGKVNKALLEKLNALDYYKVTGAKSTGREWFEKKVAPLFDHSRLGIHDQLATATEHIASIIASELSSQKIRNVLVTGGGAFNSHLIDLVRAKCKTEVVLPGDDIINFKEALIFAFLGYLRLNNRVNTLASVTGAERDSAGGAVYWGSLKA
jgi:anhydro-N-acetylmuramic acid kinase